MTDEQVAAWNAAVASEDPARIVRERRVILGLIAVEIMNDDPNYVRAGWNARDSRRCGEPDLLQDVSDYTSKLGHGRGALPCVVAGSSHQLWRCTTMQSTGIVCSQTPHQPEYVL